MGDKEDALAFGGQIFHDLHQFFNFLRGQNCGRFVENENFIIPVEHFEDLGTLLHAHGDILDQSVRIHMETVFLRQGQDFLSRLLLLQKAMLVGLHAQNDVVQHGETLHQFEVLMHHADAKVVGVVGVFDLDLPAVLFDDALLCLIQTEKNAHQSRFAGAVFTQQGVNFALLQLQGDIVVGNDAGEFFGNVKHFNSVLTLQPYRPPS